MNIEVNGHTLKVVLADNSSAEALCDLLKQGPITVSMHERAWSPTRSRPTSYSFP